MSSRSSFSLSADAPLSMGLVLAWGAFMGFAIVGLVLAIRISGSVPILLEATPR